MKTVPLKEKQDLAVRAGKFQFAPGGKVLQLSVSEEDRRFISERDRRQKQAGRSEKRLVGPLRGSRG